MTRWVVILGMLGITRPQVYQEAQASMELHLHPPGDTWEALFDLTALNSQAKSGRHM
mgnify:CR=1 FL=1|jgi:hypothetical protein